MKLLGWPPPHWTAALIAAALTALLLALTGCGAGAGGERPALPERPTMLGYGGTPAAPTTLEDADQRVRAARQELAAAEADRNAIREQERQRARDRWTLWLTVVSYLGAVGCCVAACCTPIGRKRLLTIAAALAAVPILIRALGWVDTAAGWLAPIVVIGGGVLLFGKDIREALRDLHVKRRARHVAGIKSDTA